MIKTRESAVEKQICDWAKAQGIRTYKFISPGRKGVPDRMFMKDGIVSFLEIKRPGEKPTLLQCREIRMMLEQSVLAFWCDNAPQGIQILTNIYFPKLSS